MSLSRRQLIVGAGAAIAVPTAGRAAAAMAAGDATPVGVAPEPRQSIGVIGTILQDGLDLTGFGWLTQVSGLTAKDLFTDPAQRGAPTARLLWHAEVKVGTIDVLP